MRDRTKAIRPWSGTMSPARFRVLNTCLLVGLLGISGCSSGVASHPFLSTEDRSCQATRLAMTEAIAGSPLYRDGVVVAGFPMSQERSMLANLACSGHHTVLLRAIHEAGYTPLLEDSRPFTLFAPTDAAFAEISPTGDPAWFFQPANRAMLERLAGYHIVPGIENTARMIEDSKRWGDGYAMIAISGDSLIARHDHSRAGLILRDESGSRSRIRIADIPQANGMIHVLDQVLLARQE